MHRDETPYARQMPTGLELARTTPEFSDTTVPAALRSTHRVGADTWGRLRVNAGRVRFVFEVDTAHPIELTAGEHVDIPPGEAHHVEPHHGARFVVEFYRIPRRVTSRATGEPPT